MNRLIPWLALLPILFLGVSVSASERKPGKDQKGETNQIAGPTLLVRPVGAEVGRGAEVIIPVEVIPYYGKKISLELLVPPAHGKLTRIGDAAPFTSRFLYRSDPSCHGSEEAFRFRVKAPGLAWSTYTASIRITEPPGTLEFSPSKPGVGKVPLGESSRLTLILSNRIGARVAGNLLVPAPWKIAGDPGYDLEEGQGKSFEISFTPVETGSNSILVSTVPENRSFPRILLTGEGIPPFLADRSGASLGPAETNACFTVSNTTSHGITVRWAGDSRLDYSAPAEIPPGESASLRVSLAHPELFVEGTTRVVSSLESGNYRTPFELQVDGAEGVVLLEPTGGGEFRTAAPGQTVSLDGILRNHSSRRKLLQLSLRDEGGGALHETNVTVPPQASIPFSLGWSASVTGEHEPSVILSENGREIATASWKFRIGKPTSALRIPDSPGLGDSLSAPVSQFRKATEEEAEMTLTVDPPELINGILRDHCLLHGSSPGKKGMVTIEEKVHGNSLTDRTELAEKSEERWEKLATVPIEPVKEGGGVWKFQFGMPWPGLHEYRAYPGGPGKKLIPNVSIMVTWRMFAWPLLRDMLVLLLSLLVIKVIRDRR